MVGVGGLHILHTQSRCVFYVHYLDTVCDPQHVFSVFTLYQDVLKVPDPQPLKTEAVFFVHKVGGEGGGLGTTNFTK